MLAFGVFGQAKANRSLLLLEQRNGRRAFKDVRVAQQSTFIKASLEERQRESSHSGIKSTHIILVKDKSLSQREREGGVYWRAPTSCLGDF